MKKNEKVNDAFDVALGKTMRKYRKDKRLTMEQVGQKVGCTKQMISLYELGKAAITVSMLRSICECYDVTYPELIREAAQLVEDEEVQG